MKRHSLSYPCLAAALALACISTSAAAAEQSATPAPPPPPGQAFANAADFGDFPWAALVTVDGALCSGVLVHPHYVVTAASCVDGFIDSPEVHFREVDFNGDHFQTIGTIDVDVHWDYDGTTPFDIAVLELASPAYPTTVPVLDGPQISGVHTLASWGQNENDEVDWLRWGRYQWTGNVSGPLVFWQDDGATTCAGDLGGGYLRSVMGQPTLTAIHSDNNNFTCGDATEFYAVPVNVGEIRGFLEALIPNLDTIEGFGADARDRLYQLSTVGNWQEHALQWKAYRSEDTHGYIGVGMPGTPVDCDFAPEDQIDAAESNWYFAFDQNASDDPPGSWGCYEVETPASLYLAAAYSIHRWGSPAYVRAADGHNVGIDGIDIEVFDAVSGAPASLLDACPWDSVPPLDAQAAADVCDLTNFDVVIQTIKGMEFQGTPNEFSLCADTFHEVAAPGPDIVFDPPEGETVMTTAEIAERFPEALAPRLDPDGFEPAGPGFPSSEQPHGHGQSELPTSEKEQVRPSSQSTPSDGGGRPQAEAQASKGRLIPAEPGFGAGVVLGLSCGN